MVVFIAVLLLFGAPAILLWMGKLIAQVTDFRNRVVRVSEPLSGDEWYFRARAPSIHRENDAAALDRPSERPAATTLVDERPWFSRPMKPLFHGNAWFRSPWRTQG